MGLEDLKKQAEEGLEKAKETFGEENVEKAVEAAKDKATLGVYGVVVIVAGGGGGGGAGPPPPFRMPARHCVPSPTPTKPQRFQRFPSPRLVPLFRASK